MPYFCAVPKTRSEYVNRPIRITLLVILALIAVGAAYSMWLRTQEELLWGYRPLVLFLSFWLFWTGLVRPGFFRKGRPYRWLGLSALSAVLLSVGFPDLLPLPVLLFVGWVPLLLVEREIAREVERRSGWEVAKYAYFTFVLWNILTTYWVANTALAAGIVAILLNAALMVIPFWLFHLARKAMPALGYAAFIAFWITFEYFHLNWELTWPWLTLGNGFAEVPAWVQWYEYTGVFGGTLWILTANILALQVWLKRKEIQAWRWPAVRLGLWLLLPLAFSLWRYATYEEKGTPIDVIVVQPNFEPHYEKFAISPSRQLDRFLRLSDSLLDEQVQYIVYPETVFGGLELTRLNQFSLIRGIRDHFKAYPGLHLVTGLDAYRIYAPGEPKGEAVRQHVRSPGDTTFYESSNIAAQITMGEEDIQLYLKSKLVPGPENFPYNELLWFFEPVVDQLGGTTAGLATQPERSVFISTAPIGPVICYESVFGEYYGGYVRQGAQAIFIMTNDGWWDNTAGHRQHLHFASLRAIETRRSIARSANTGISAFISQRGDIRQPTAYGETTAIRQQILLNDALTLYVRMGDMIGRVAMFLAALILLNVLARRLRGVVSS